MDTEDIIIKKADQRIKEFYARKDKIASVYQQSEEETPQKEEKKLNEIDEAIQELENKIKSINKSDDYRGWGGIQGIFSKTAKDIDKAISSIEETIK